MKMNRRVLLAGTAALALMLAHPQPAKAFKLGKAQPLGWQVLPLGAGLDLPPVQNLTGFAAIRGDPNLYDRLFAATGNKGFAVYEP